jgi:hypothetical protein
MEVQLNKPFAANSAVDEFDTRQIKKALNRLGYYQPYEKTGITGIPDTDVFAALKAFQKDRGLTPTGTAKPDDETVKALNGESAKKRNGQYIWRTVGDRRVRPEHAALDGTLRDFSDSPDPGDDFNCRCWAEVANTKKVSDCEAKQIALINAEAKLFIVQKHLESAEKEKAGLENRKSKQERELVEIEKQIKEEKDDKESARRIGAGIGALVAGAMSSRGGSGGMLAGAGLGMGPGSKIGTTIEEAIDVITRDPTDYSLKIKIAEIHKEMDSLQKMIDLIIDRIFNILQPVVDKAKIDVQVAKEVYLACRNEKEG